MLKYLTYIYNLLKLTNEKYFKEKTLNLRYIKRPERAKKGKFLAIESLTNFIANTVVLKKNFTAWNWVAAYHTRPPGTCVSDLRIISDIKKTMHIMSRVSL